MWSLKRTYVVRLLALADLRLQVVEQLYVRLIFLPLFIEGFLSFILGHVSEQTRDQYA